MNNIESFVSDLLHIDEVNKNKMLDLEAGKDNTYYLTYGDPADNMTDLTKNGVEILKIIKSHIGKVGNTVLRGSAEAGSDEQLIGAHKNVLNWCSRSGERNPRELDKYIKAVYKELDLTGNNPLFLSIGTVSWKLVSTGNETRAVETPFLIFPIRLIRSVATSPISIEFIDEDIYINPCFVAKLRQVYGEEILRGFPSPSGNELDFDTPVDLDVLGDGVAYFDAVEKYMEACRGTHKDNVFSFDRNVVAISQYDHDEICMYYDIKRHKDEVYSHPLVNRMFTESVDGNIPPMQEFDGTPSFIKEYDHIQEDMIRRVLAGESLIIKGPPGTGKTLTIVNMIATLLEQGKKVMLASEKLAALSEVYNKLPDELRDFVMLLACETEAQAAKLNPSIVKRELSALVRQAEEAAPLHSSIYSDKNSALSRMSLSRRALVKYFTETFYEKDVIGLNYYEALDIVEKHPDIEVPMVKDKPFAEPMCFIGMDREVYNSIYSTVKEAARHYSALTGKETHPMILCPWYSFISKLENTDLAVELNRKTSERVGDVLATADSLFAGAEIEDFLGLGITETRDLLEADVTEEEVILFSEKNRDAIDILREAYLELCKIPENVFDSIRVKHGEEFDAAAAWLSGTKLDPALNMHDIEVINSKRELLSSIRLIEEISLNLIIGKIDKLNEEILAHREKMYEVFPTNITEEQLKKIEEAVKSLAKYRGKGEPKLLFGAPKTAIKELSAISYLANPTFEQIVAGVCEMEDMLKCDAAISELDNELAKLFRRAVTKSDREAVLLLCHKSNQLGIPADDYLRAVTESYEVIQKAIASAEGPVNVTVGELQTVFAAANALNTVCLNFSLFSGTEFKPTEDGVVYSRELLCKMKRDAKCAIAVCKFIYNDTVKFKPIEELARAVVYLTENGKPLARAIDDMLKSLKDAGEKTFKNYYSERQDDLIFAYLNIYLLEACDKSVLNAAERYFAIRSTKFDAISVASFFFPFEASLADRGEYEFEEIFEHSAYELACRAKRLTFETKNGRGNEISRQMDIFAEADDKVREYNVKTIRESCLRRIRACDKSSFAFLNSSRDNINNLRKIFKNYGESILKLKKCMLVSPATVSVLFGADCYSDFDVLIVDESSQLEPTKILPVLFRSKQVVLVGDEWQMPPIRHFTKAAEHTIVSDNGTMTNLSPETSVLALALHSKQFDCKELGCHYRSKTEALIAFSQSNYYPYMRTFPAPIPRADGLGFKDVYIADGRSEGGVNEAEARAAIAELEAHFDKYYDPETGVLSESVGVVAFGESQLSKIESYVKANLTLKSKIGRALDNFDDLPEKLVFFKTIETVQGQETDHMIISLTYGKDKNGNIREAYGDLGRGSFGECIFNVAVTRARASVTMIHSVRHTEIENRFIKSYLEITEKFDRDGRMQFISAGDTKKLGFIRSVADFIIEELGIPEERVVINCGATEGSVRLPIAILSPDMSEAMLAIFCETPSSGTNYIDDNIRYYNILRSRGWNLHKVFIHDWVDNKDNEKQTIAEAIERFVGIGEE